VERVLQGEIAIGLADGRLVVVAEAGHEDVIATGAVWALPRLAGAIAGNGAVGVLFTTVAVSLTVDHLFDLAARFPLDSDGAQKVLRRIIGITGIAQENRPLSCIGIPQLECDPTIGEMSHIGEDPPRDIGVATKDEAVEASGLAFYERNPVNYLPAGTSSYTFFCTAPRTGAVFCNPAWLKKTPTS
jgi:hypothetical protein